MKTINLKESEKLHNDIMNKLYRLEDLNLFRLNKLSKVIKIMQDIKWKQE